MIKKNEAPVLNGRLEGKRKLWVAGIGSMIFIVIFLGMIVFLIPEGDAFKALEILSKFLISVIGIFGLANGVEHLAKKSNVVNKFFKKGGRSDE